MELFVNMILGNALAATLLAVLAAASRPLFKRPALTHSLWLIVMLKLVTPPIIPISFLRETGVVATPSARPELPPELASASVFPAASPNEKLTSGTAWVEDDEPSVSGESGATIGVVRWPYQWRAAPAIFLGIFAGAIGWWLTAAVRIASFQRTLRRIAPGPGQLQSQANVLAQTMGLHRAPTVYLIPGRVPPMLWSLGGRSRLLLPAELWRSLGELERTSLVLHELAHLRRRDHWVRWLELIITGLYWWHPVVWWGLRALREVEEQCCDAWVVWAMPRRSRTYAAALLAAVEFVSGASTVPAVSTAVGGGRHVRNLKRRLRMIMREKTPKDLSWSGRIAVLGVAALLLPLAPSWAQIDQKSDDILAQTESVDRIAKPDTLNLRDLESTIEAKIAKQLLADRDLAALIDEIAAARDSANSPDTVDLESAPGTRAGRAAFGTQPRAEARRQLGRLVERYTKLRKQKHDLLLANLAQDGADARKRKENDDDLEDKARDAAEHFQEQLQDLIDKIGKQFSPVTEEIRKALDQAVGEVHKSLDKESLSMEDLSKALESAQNKLKRAFEGGGPVDKELREAIEHSRDELKGALERGKSEVQDKVDALRDRTRELSDDARESLERAKEAAQKDGAGAPVAATERKELEEARREIRALEQQLRRSTRRLEELERRELRHEAAPRRERMPRGETPSAASPSQPEKPQPPRAPAIPTTPARPAQPSNPRRVLPPARGGPGFGGRRGQQSDNNERRIQELEEKMKTLLKELESLKDEKPST